MNIEQEYTCMHVPAYAYGRQYSIGLYDFFQKPCGLQFTYNTYFAEQFRGKFWDDAKPTGS